MDDIRGMMAMTGEGNRTGTGSDTRGELDTKVKQEMLNLIMGKDMTKTGSDVTS